MQLNEIENKKTYKVYLDLDGVLADFVKGVKKLIPDYDDTEYQKDPQYRKKMWDAIGDYTKSGGKHWTELDLMPDAMVLWDYVSRHDDIEILSATGDTKTNEYEYSKAKYAAEDQKREWVKKHLGDIKTNIVHRSPDKAKFAAPTHILIDDMQKSIGPWEEAGGIGILHTSAKDTIKKLKKLGL